jgi:hypothetical protein
MHYVLYFYHTPSFFSYIWKIIFTKTSFWLSRWKSVHFFRVLLIEHQPTISKTIDFDCWLKCFDFIGHFISHVIPQNIFIGCLGVMWFPKSKCSWNNEGVQQNSYRLSSRTKAVWLTKEWIMLPQAEGKLTILWRNKTAIIWELGQ